MIRKCRRVGAVAALVLVPTLSGCAAGLDAQTSQEYQPTEAVNASHQGIEIRNLFVLGPTPGQRLPAGSAAAVYVTFINNTGRADRLVSVGAPGTAQTGRLPGGSVDLPPQQLVSPGAPDAQAAQGTQPRASEPITLVRLSAPLLGGEWRRLTFRFEQAGTVTVSVPIVPRQGPYTTYSPAPEPAPPAGGPVRPGEATSTPSPGSAGPSPSPSPKAAGEAEQEEEEEEEEEEREPAQDGD